MALDWAQNNQWILCSLSRNICGSLISVNISPQEVLSSLLQKGEEPDLHSKPKHHCIISCQNNDQCCPQFSDHMGWPLVELSWWYLDLVHQLDRVECIRFFVSNRFDNLFFDVCDNSQETHDQEDLEGIEQIIVCIKRRFSSFPPYWRWRGLSWRALCRHGRNADPLQRSRLHSTSAINH